MARRVRVRIENSQHEDDSDDGYEQETPRPNKIRKRLSESNNPDASFGADSESGSGSGRPPLHTVNINDDAAEKRRRRKSTRNLLDTSQPGPSSDANMDSEIGAADTPRSRAQRQLNSVVPPPDIAVPLDVMTSNYEEWMKMATDNKITATNTWDFALIDYFHDMQLLRNVDDNSINFQRASCTLDGCVKIWTSRVDSVGAETGKLLSNLANDMHGDDEEGDSDNPDAGPSEKRKRRVHRGGSTLVKDPAQLRSKKMDLEFSVDPLFRKTCADFDEGGASGLLMNHLSLGIGEEGSLRVIFDASDSTGDKEDGEVEPLPEMPMDLSYLRETFLPDLSALDDLEIAPSLADFSFDNTTIPDEETQLYQDDTHVDLNGFNDDDDSVHGGDGGAAMDIDGGDLGPPPAEDFFNDQPLQDEYGGGGGYYGGDEDDSLAPEERSGRPGPEEPFDPSRKPNERDLVMALADPDANGGMLEYFEKNFLKNWAGPEHWKIRKPIRKADATADKPKAKREKKEAFKIDFLTPPTKSLKELTEELFKEGKASINLPGTGSTAKKGKKTKEKEVKNDHRLPDDMHFTSRQLVTLFLKPKFTLKMRGRTVAFNENGDGEVAQQFWAQNAADQAAGRTGDEVDDNDPAPFNTQFFNDDDDLPGGFDDGFDAEILTSIPANEEQDLLAATQGQTRRVKPERVKYTKRAKRVDVRKLKENIWKGLQIIVPDSPEDEDADDSMDIDKDEQQPTDPGEARVFSSVIDDLQRAYPPEKMDDISTSFCFICLLHLANEQGLKLEPENSSTNVTGEDDETKVEREIGNLWDVKVYRDPEVGKNV